MGESFMGFPNRLRACGSASTDFNYNHSSSFSESYPNELDTTYNPNHALSSYYGYLMSRLYLNRCGGMEFAMSGTLYTTHVLPKIGWSSSEHPPNIGSEQTPYWKIYASELHGTADIALKLGHKVNLAITGAVTGKGSFDGSEATVTVNTTVNHNHDERYLKLTGGTMTGDITLSGVSTGINNTKKEQMLGYNSAEDRTKLGYGSYLGKHGRLDLYSYNNMTIQFPDNSRAVQLRSGNTASAQLGFSGGMFHISPDGNRGLWMSTSDGKLYYRGWNGTRYIEYEICHKGNLDSLGGSSYLKLTGGTMTGQIRKPGVSSQWVTGRDNAMIRQTTNTGYTPILSAKTTSGSWEFGPYTRNSMYLAYITDANYDGKTNKVSTQYVFNSDGTLVAPKISGSFTGSATFNQDVTVIHGKGIRFMDKNDRLALKLWCGDDGDGNENRYLHMSVAENDGYVSSKCFAHFDRAYGFFNSRVPFRGDHSILGILRHPKKPSDCSCVVIGDTDDNGKPKDPYFEYDLGHGVQITSSIDAFIPTASGKLTLGDSNHKWGQIWSTKAAISTSDRNLKENIHEIPDVFKKVYADLLPVVYHWKSSEETGTNHDRQHAGFISQDVESALIKHGLTSMDFGGVCIDEKHPLKKNPFYGKTREEISKYLETHPETIGADRVVDCSDPYLDEEDITKNKVKQYSLRHEEIIPLNTYMIQQLMAKVDYLEVLAGLKDELEYPGLADPDRYSYYNKK